MINQHGHGISYDKVKEIETESRIIIPKGVTANNCDSSVAIMVADNIDNHENTMTGSGTSHDVNSTLVTMKAPETNEEVEEGEKEYCPPTKRKCRSFILKQSQVKFPIIMEVNVLDPASLMK